MILTRFELSRQIFV